MIYLIQAQLNLEFVLNELQALQAIDYWVLLQLSRWPLLLATEQDRLSSTDTAWLPPQSVQHKSIYNFCRSPQFLANTKLNAKCKNYTV